MLRITILEETLATRFVLEGKLVEPWVGELRKCWKTKERVRDRRPVVDLAGVTQIDLHGEALLSEMHLQGTELLASGLLTRAIIEGIQKAHR
jgi:hypothetical protein